MTAAKHEAKASHKKSSSDTELAHLRELEREAKRIVLNGESWASKYAWRVLKRIVERSAS